MPLETGATIAELDDTWPESGDLIPAGDDHLRLIKSVLKTQFPGAGGDGFSIPITAEEAEINHLSGVTSNVQTQINTESTTRLNADNALDTRVDALESVNHISMNDVFPVGAVYITAGNTNPGSLLGVGTWSARAQGRFIVGVGSGNDGAEGRSYGAGNSATGSYRHQLTTAEMPSHNHNLMGSSGSDNDATGLRSGQSGVAGEASSQTGYQSTNAHGSTWVSSTGSNGRHENSPPAFGLYIWQRTA